MDFSPLQSRSPSAYFPPHRTQLHPRMHPFSSSHAPLPPNPKSPFPPRQKWLILAASLFLIPFLFYLFAIARGVHQSSRFSAPKLKGFGIVISASPAALQVRIFEFLLEGRVPFVDTSGRGSTSLKIRPGLIGFGDDAGRSLLELIRFVKERVPRSEWGSTKVQLMASAELDKLGLGDAILESCRRVLRASGFLFKDEWAAVMKGEEEGVYAWVAVNYALGTLGQEPEETTGIVELGGDSVQVTFAPSVPPPLQFSRIIKLAGVVYNLYTQSLPQLGQDAAWESLQEFHGTGGLASLSSSSKRFMSNPCIPKGYRPISKASEAELLISHPAGNFSACKLEALAFLKGRRDKCLHPPCEIVSYFPVELRGKPIPPKKFFYTSEIFGLAPKASLSELEVVGQHYCEDGWDQLKKHHHSIDDLDLSKYCFFSAYLVALIHDNLGIPMEEKRIGLANLTAGDPLDWTLGAFMIQTMLEPLELEEDDIGEMVGNESLTYFSLFAFLLIAAMAVFFVLKLQKPPLKTIYDLEKGRYIITTVPR